MKREEYIVMDRKAKRAMSNYLAEVFSESEEEIFNLLCDAEIKYASTFYDLFKACLEFDDHVWNKNISIKIPLKWFNKLSNVGIIGFKAGEMLRHYYIVSRVINKH